MGFDSFHNKTSHNPAKVYHQWRGGEGKLTHWDGTANVETQLPFKFAVLEQTRRVTGFAPTGAGATRYYSNETVSYDEEIKVKKKVGNNPAEDVISGKYADIKEKLPAGARLATNLYIFNPATRQIEQITLQGASLGAFIEFSKKNRIYENWMTINKGAEKVNGTVHYFPPEYGLADAYTSSELEALTAADKEVVDYQRGLMEKRADGDSAVDQTPAVYEGEMSQEMKIVDDGTSAQQEEGGVDFNNIPF